jgi:hypothetical protein
MTETAEQVAIDDFVDFVDFTPPTPGTYTGSLSETPEVTTTQGGAPSIVAKIAVIEGPSNVDEEIRNSYFLGTYKTKTGKRGSFGISQIRADLAAIGKPLPKEAKVDVGEDGNILEEDAFALAKRLAKSFGTKPFRFQVSNRPNKDGTKTYTDIKVLGFAGSSSTSSGLDDIA